MNHFPTQLSGEKPTSDVRCLFENLKNVKCEIFIFIEILTENERAENSVPNHVKIMKI